jgi:hypothetical protein
MKRAAFLVVLIALAGCAAPATPGEAGTVDGYEYNQSIAVNATDGLNESEQAAVVSRTMARIEVLRDLEFEETVEVQVITRNEYRQQQRPSNETHTRWNNQVWEGLFIVGENRSIDTVFNQTLGSAVAGYYDPQTDEIVIVSDSDTPTLKRGTLVHELVHALQDQRFDLSGNASTQDAQLARSGVIEGEANLIEERYGERCDGGWDCVEFPPQGSSGGGDIDQGVLLVILTPYVTGPSFVEHVESQGGWDAVNDLYDDYPESAEQVIHPERYPDDNPANVTVPDRSSEDWSRFNHDPVADTVGQASIHAMFLTNGIQSQGVQPYSYTHPAAEGWAGDALVPYHSGDQYGYVWETAWENRSEAREFRETYVTLLESHGATARSDGVYVVPESNPFGDAFRVVQDGSRVRIVNAPSVDDLSAVHATPAS